MSRFRKKIHQVTWSDEEVAVLRKLTRQGKSAREIGAQLKRPRNSVIGKWKRDRDKTEGLIKPEDC